MKLLGAVLLITGVMYGGWRIVFDDRYDGLPTKERTRRVLTYWALVWLGCAGLYL